jgi:hypothetical protein
MRLPREAYPFHAAIAAYLPDLTAAQQRGLALWVYGTILAGSACQTAVLLALRPVFGLAAQHALRQLLREWGADGADKAAPCRTEVCVPRCFAPLLRWVLAWWGEAALPLALDATAQRDRLVVLSVSVLYRGSAIPVAWHVLPAHRRGAWLPAEVALLAHLAPAVPPGRTVLLLADRGLWSPWLWTAIRRHGWHPMLRIRPDATFQPAGGRRGPVQRLVPGPGHAWIGAGVAFSHARVRRAATLIVTWERGQAEPWAVLTDLPPTKSGPCWYGLRTWIELGFRALKSLGWHWERTRRLDPDRVARHWLVLAVATLWTLATGTREEDAARWGREPANLRVALPPPPGPFARVTSVFALGLTRLRWQLLRVRRLWSQVWLWPEPWPTSPPDLRLVVVPTPGPRPA